MDGTRGARLLQMQQKQLQERDKLAQQARASDGVSQSPRNGVRGGPRAPAPARTLPDKARQTFEERRAKAGLDKISPRQQILAGTTRGKHLAFNIATNAVEKKISKAYTSNSSSNIVKKQSITKIGKVDTVNGSGDVSQTHETDFALEVAPQSKGDISIRSNQSKAANGTDNAENKKKDLNLSNKPLRQTKSLIKINPAKVISPRIPKPPVGEACGGCGRRFAPDRLTKHQEICKTGTKERIPFDALKHRLAGTEAETYLKLSEGGCKEQSQNSWRQKHEELIQTLRAAREVQVNAGGSDLSPSLAHPESNPVSPLQPPLQPHLQRAPHTLTGHLSR